LPAVAIIGAIGWLVTLSLDAHSAMLAYLVAFLSVAEISLGCLLILMIGFLVPGRWFETIRIPLSAGALAICAALILLIPILLGLSHLYVWAQTPSAVSGFKSVYLSPLIFVLRNLAYFVLWAAIAFLCLRARGNEIPRRRVASWGLVAFAITASLAGVDWIESLKPDFHSSVYGLLFMSSQLLAGLSFVMAAMPVLYKSERPMRQHGGLLLSCVLVWAYLHGMQYIIIWAANRPNEVVWYIDRSTHGWSAVTWFVYLSQFIFPFAAFLFSRFRRSTNDLEILAGFFIVVRVVESFWLVLPGETINTAVFIPSAIFALMACGAFFWLAFAFILDGLAHGKKWVKPFASIHPEPRTR
jgi:hypothetical protein